jgi:exonuclease VII small subunit
MHRKTKIQSLMVFIGLSVIMVAGGAQAGDDEKYIDKHMRLAFKDANHGYDELAKVNSKLDLGKQKSAERHFENAIDDFEQAIAHLAQAELGKDQKGIVDDLTTALDKLKKAAKNLENGNLKDAQAHYAGAEEHLERAEAALEKFAWDAAAAEE